MSSLWDRVAGVKAEDVVIRRPYFKEGSFTVRIANVLTRENRNGTLFFIVEAVVLESTNPAVKIGATHAWVQKTNIDAGPPAIAAFIAAANGWTPEDEEFGQMDAQFCAWMESEESPIIGKEMGLHCEAILTKDGEDFTRHTWEPAKTDPELMDRFAAYLETLQK